MSGDTQWMQALHELDRAAWSLAAIVTAIRDAEPAALAVLDVLGVDLVVGEAERERIAATAAAPLLQASRFIMGGPSWEVQDDEAVLAQGQASAAAGAFFPERLLPQLPGGADFVTRPVRMLDVGVGVAAMAVALCEHMPQLSIVGLDVLARPLELAQRNVDEAGFSDRIELRQLDVADLDAVDEFDLAWLPAPFIPRPSLEAGLARVAQAVRPGGWVLLGHGRFQGDAFDAAVTRFKTVAYGGTPLDDAEARDLLARVGLVEITDLQSPPGAPAFTAGQRSLGP